MKQLFRFWIVAALLLAAGCAEVYDDSALVDRVDDLESRVQKLEQLCQQMNTNISSLQTIVTALQNNDYVTACTTLMDDGVQIGYTITFAKSGSMVIYHGKDGKDGADGKDGQNGSDGKDGADGKDGYTPVIGIKQDTDGIYYWTLDGEWLLDDAGNKIEAQGVDGKDGVDGEDGADGENGKDGEDGKDGTDGINGADGKDGITPQLKIENDYWYVSYDDGASWTQLGKAKGEDGKDGDSFFQSVTQDENSVYFTLADGTVITTPKGVALSIEFAESDLVVMSPNSTREIGYNVTSATETVKVEVTSSADIKAKVVADDANGLTGQIHITTGDAIDEYSKVIVFVSNGDKVIMRSITFEEAGLVVEENATRQATAEGGEVVLEFLSNIECEVVIPEEAQSWISVVPATRAMEKHTITLKLEPNEGAARSAEVIVESVDGKLSLTYTISQEPNLDYQLALEREALIAIYNALDGDNWTNNENWCSDKPVGEWYGVYVNPYGEVKGAIESIELYFNNAQGDIPAEIQYLKNLKSLRIGDLNISSIPKEIGELTKLTYLDIGGHAVKTTPKEIDNLVNLTNLSLWGENVTDFQPTLSTLTKLERASIFINSGNGFISGLANLKNLKNLEYISKMTQFPDEIREMTQLEYLSFTYSKMQGVTIPSWLSELTNLTYLSLYGCELTGSIPEELGNLINLENLALGVNSLTGTIPESFKNLTKLQELNIKYNNLYGKIPSEVVNMPWFQYRWGDILLGNNFDTSEIELYGPKFNFTDINGANYNSDDIYKANQYTIFYQWRPAENLETTQLLKSLYETYHDRGLEIIADTGDSLEEIKSMNTPWINFIHGIETGNHIYVNSDPYYTIDSYPMGYWGIPCTTVIDSNGAVVYSNLTNNASITTFLAKQFDNAGSELYESTDYTQDGVVTSLQTATKGSGIDIVLMGDAYSDRQIADGTYQEDMESIYNNLFTEEPYKSFKDHFNVHYVNVVSKNEGYGAYNETALSGYFGDGTLVGGNDNAVFNYAQKAISAEQMDEALLIVAMNSDNYAGTCYMYYPTYTTGTYGSGPSVAYFPRGGDATTFTQLLHHEACGHGFAKLADEYAYEDMGAVPSDYVSEIKSQQSNWGWWKNVDFTSDPTATRWNHFINDTRYANEGLGAYEGGLTYWTGVWRPTENSIMRYNTGGFNAPSREAIYYRIHKLAYGDSWEYDYEDFVEWDARNRTTAATRAMVYKPANYKPTHPPVIVNKPWRDAK
ncbi:MAG: hypothetical protein IJV84_06710 [Bacteroidales bacterium]|nr:hypothetical protein [Bacteroidales bacterium]